MAALQRMNWRQEDEFADCSNSPNGKHHLRTPGWYHQIIQCHFRTIDTSPSLRRALISKPYQQQL